MLNLRCVADRQVLYPEEGESQGGEPPGREQGGLVLDDLTPMDAAVYFDQTRKWAGTRRKEESTSDSTMLQEWKWNFLFQMFLKFEGKFQGSIF